MMDDTANLPDAGGSDSPDPVDLIARHLVREQNPAPEPEAEAAEPEPGRDDEAPPDEDGEETEAPDEQNDAEPELYTVKAGGNEIQVTRDELIRGYQRLSDYSRNIQQVAEQRKYVEAESQRIAAEREHYASQLDQFAAVLAQSMPQEPDWVELARTASPQDFSMAKALWEDRTRKLHAVAQERQRVAQLQSVEHERHEQAWMQQEQQRLLEAVPEWREPKAAEAEQRLIHRTLREAGYTDEEIGGVKDSRAVIIARKAALYDRLMAAKPAVQQRVANAPKMVKPGAQAPAPDKRKALLQQLKRSGSVDDAAAVIASRR